MAPLPRPIRSILVAAFVLSAAFAVASTTKPAIEITYFGEIGCDHCDTFVAETVPALEAEYDLRLDVEAVDILTPEGYEEYTDRLAAIGRKPRVFPGLFIGNNAYQGNSAIDVGLEEELDFFLREGRWRPQVPPEMDGSVGSVSPPTAGRIALLPVFVAGLADGINPCAFATMLFLVSLLTLFGESRGRLLLVGLLYGLTIFVTYFALGLGLLTVLRSAMNVALLRLLLRVAVSTGALFFAVLTLRDALLIKAGRSGEATLQLSRRAKVRIHSVMRRRLGSGGIILGTVLAAFLVSLLELACTGQLYLPTIAYLVQTGSTEATEILALAGYNLAFVLPLFALFAAIYSGVTSVRVNRWFRRNAGTAKALSALALLVLAGAIWLL